MLPSVGDNLAKLYLVVYLYETNIITLLKFREKIVRRPTANRELHDLMITGEQGSSSSSESESENGSEDSVKVSEDKAEGDSKGTVEKVVKVIKSVPTRSVNNISAPKGGRGGQITEPPKETMLRRKRKATPLDLRMKTWKEVCYICNDYGELICCDGCTNVAHLFCTCLQVMLAS
jgi:hypothetical protein